MNKSQKLTRADHTQRVRDLQLSITELQARLADLQAQWSQAQAELNTSITLLQRMLDKDYLGEVE